MTSARFLADLRANLVRGDAALERRLMLDQWVYQPGLPDNAARPDPAAFAAVDRALAAYQRGRRGRRDPLCAAGRRRSGCASSTACRATLAAERLAALDGAFRLSRSGNAEVLFAWLQLALANRYEPAVPAAERFLDRRWAGASSSRRCSRP